MCVLPPDASAGLFGKLPARGDFVRENLPRDFTDGWDAWWQRGLADLQEKWREEWRDAWLEAPVWRFMLPPGLCGRSGMLGLWLPSVDKVGRYSPLTIAAAAPCDWLPYVGGMTSFLAAAEEAARDALEHDIAPIELLQRIQATFVAPASATHLGFRAGAGGVVDRGRSAGSRAFRYGNRSCRGNPVCGVSSMTTGALTATAPSASPELRTLRNA